MDIKNVLINLRDDLMKWTTNNIKALQATIPSTDDFATPEYVDEKLEDIDLTSYVKTVNGVSPNENGNVNITGNCKVAYGTCSTEEATAEKTVVVEDTNWELEVGSIVAVKFSVSNSASNVKINVNGTGAYPIWAAASEYTGASTSYAGYKNRIYIYMFNGTHWAWISCGVYPSSTSNASLGHGYGVCDTAEATLTKECTISSYTLSTGGSVSVKFTNAVPANSTLNIRTRGAKKIFYKGVAITDGVIKAGDTATFVYDGTQYQLISIDSPSSSSSPSSSPSSSSTKKGTEVFFIAGDKEASTQGHWVGQHPDITELYEGLVIAYQIPIEGGTSNTYIKINDFAETIIYLNRATAMKEQYLVGATIFLVYTNYNNKLTFRVADYDTNTNTRNTVGDYQSTDTKLYLAGSTTIDTSDDDSYATSFVNPNVYIGTDNALYSENKKVATEEHVDSEIDILEQYVKDEVTRLENAGDMDLTLKVHTDGLLYIFKNGEPVGLGISLGSGNSGGGSGDTTIPENRIIDIPGIVYNERISQSSGGMSTSSATGMFTFALQVDPGVQYCLSFEGLPLPLNQSVSGTSNHVIYGLKSYNPIGTIHTVVGSKSNIKDMGSNATANSVTFTTSSSTPTNYIMVSIAVTNGTSISASDVAGITYKLEKI